MGVGGWEVVVCESLSNESVTSWSPEQGGVLPQGAERQGQWLIGRSLRLRAEETCDQSEGDTWTEVCVYRQVAY